MPKDNHNIGIVVIGRNEGERLIACFDSIAPHAERTVYVDSGSTDDSVAEAERRNITVVSLDLSQPFTAARARNVGYQKLVTLHPETDYVQFVDGDCAVDADWITTAAAHLESHDTLAVVCGRRREIHPDASVYNRLCDIEWDTPVGPANACGGDAMFRRTAFDAVEGYNPDLIAGEEPELCFRMRQRDWQIERIDAEMTRHDAAMTSFAQWFRRHRRAGHAYAEGGALHGNSPERYCFREVQSIVFWAFALPVALIVLAVFLDPLALFAFAIYPMMMGKIALGQMRRGRSRYEALLYGASCMKAKFPQALGLLQFSIARLRGRRNTIIEYK